MKQAWADLSVSVKQYFLITFNYWAFTLTDGALRMLVVLYFYNLGYSPLTIAFLFLFYEFFGVVTNLIGGWLGAKLGLNTTMNIGLFLQILALTMLAVPNDMLTIIWVMAAQALSGIAKDLNKMSAKSAIKLLVPKGAEGTLFKWVALLTGSKNTLKGIGFFLGGLLLTLFGFQIAVTLMAGALSLVWLLSIFQLKGDIGKAKFKPKFSDLFSKSRAINTLSAARLFLFASRDAWFVIALPVYLASTLRWDHSQVGAFLAVWVIGYGFVQAIAPRITGKQTLPTGKHAFLWALILTSIPAAIALGLNTPFGDVALFLGLFLFGLGFAINSSIHSFLIVSYATDDGVSLDVGFYYMANAMGRLLGTILSGWLFQIWGLSACLWVSSALLLSTTVVSIGLPNLRKQPAKL